MLPKNLHQGLLRNSALLHFFFHQQATCGKVSAYNREKTIIIFLTFHNDRWIMNNIFRLGGEKGQRTFLGSLPSQLLLLLFFFLRGSASLGNFGPSVAKQSKFKINNDFQACMLLFLKGQGHQGMFSLYW